MLSFMIATGFLSMWTSNNSTTLMMLPIGLAIIAREKELGADTKRFAPALMLSIAYSASIGGTGTLVGTPPNLVFVSTAQELLPNSPDILFTDWLKIGIPFVVLFLPIAWIYIVKFFNVSGDLQGRSNVIQKEYTDLGEMSLAEKKELIVVLLYAFGFIFRDSWSSFLGVSGFVKDSTVAFFAAIALFLDNKTAKASGESTDYYDGFKKASLQVLDLLEILITEEPEEKIIRITKKESTRVRDQKLAKEIWG